MAISKHIKNLKQWPHRPPKEGTVFTLANKPGRRERICTSSCAVCGVGRGDWNPLQNRSKSSVAEGSHQEERARKQKANPEVKVSFSSASIGGIVHQPTTIQTVGLFNHQVSSLSIHWHQEKKKINRKDSICSNEDNQKRVYQRGFLDIFLGFEFRARSKVKNQLPIVPTGGSFIQGYLDGCHLGPSLALPPFLHDCQDQEIGNTGKLDSNDLYARVPTSSQCPFRYLSVLKVYRTSIIQSTRAPPLPSCTQDPHPDHTLPCEQSQHLRLTAAR